VYKTIFGTFKSSDKSITKKFYLSTLLILSVLTHIKRLTRKKFTVASTFKYKKHKIVYWWINQKEYHKFTHNYC